MTPDEVDAAIEAHAGQIYEATRALMAQLDAPPAPRWADLSARSRKRFAKSTADALADLATAVQDVDA